MQNVDRFVAWEQERIRKLEEKRLQTVDSEERELRELREKPITNRTQCERKRTTKQFYNDQQAFLSKKEKNAQTIARQVTE